MSDAIGFDAVIARAIMVILRKSHLFRELDDAELAAIAPKFTIDQLEPGKRLFSEGERGESFYFVLAGHVAVSSKIRGEDQHVSMLKKGDFFGEGSLLTNSLRRASVTAVDAVILLRMGRLDFNDLVQKHPGVRNELAAVSQGYQIANRKRFDWLMEDEGLHLVARKHPMILILNELPVAFLASLSLTVLAFGFQLSMQILDYAGGAGLVAALLWGLWRYLDWADDYYIVTDKRVVWLEETILLYQSTSEAKLTEVRSVDISTDLLQRIFGYGNLHINTYSGTIIMRNIGQPEQFKGLIEEYWHRARERAKQDTEVHLNERLRERMGLAVPKRKTRPAPVSIAALPTQEEKQPPSLFQELFTNFFRMRYLEGDTIVYRTHWYVLLQQVFMPTLALAALLVGGIYLLNNLPGRLTTILFVVLLIVCLGWWFYQYWDWRDDKYEISPTSITDTDRTPLGRENRQTAPLESILSLEHERKGILGILLNFGSVSINVGERTYQFEHVHNPARVRQEVSDHQQARRQQLERERLRQDEDRQIEWLARYHGNAQELWPRPDSEKPDDENKYKLK